MRKKFFIISGMSLKDNNRGTAALGYGAFSFLLERGFVTEGMELLEIKYNDSLFRKDEVCEKISIQGSVWNKRTVYVSLNVSRIQRHLGIVLPFTKLARIQRQVAFVAAINGGDGFSDIYNTNSFRDRLADTILAMSGNVPLIQLPQTLGPFSKPENYELAKRILQYSQHVYIRDTKYVSELEKMGVKYEITKDLSAYMQPEEWNIDIAPGSIGINVSGLAYSNNFRALSGQFDAYPELIEKIITHFQTKNKTIYLIPHSYNYNKPEVSNDDLEASKAVYNSLIDKTNVVIIDKDLISPQIKYLISKMSFFIGTRMHANFAAIYTHVPVFGLAYSYKFEGAFEANGLSKDQTCLINNINNSDIEKIIKKIDSLYTQNLPSLISE